MCTSEATHKTNYTRKLTNYKMMQYSICVQEYTSTFSSSRYDPPQNTHTGSGTYAIPSTQWGGRVTLGSSYTSDASSFSLSHILTSPLQAVSYQLWMDMKDKKTAQICKGCPKNILTVTSHDHVAIRVTGHVTYWDFNMNVCFRFHSNVCLSLLMGKTLKLFPIPLSLFCHHLFHLIIICDLGRGRGERREGERERKRRERERVINTV